MNIGRFFRISREEKKRITKKYISDYEHDESDYETDEESSSDMEIDYYECVSITHSRFVLTKEHEVLEDERKEKMKYARATHKKKQWNYIQRNAERKIDMLIKMTYKRGNSFLLNKDVYDIIYYSPYSLLTELYIDVKVGGVYSPEIKKWYSVIISAEAEKKKIDKKYGI